MSTLEGQRVLIVGGARDIGFAVAQAVSEAGGIPIIGARDAHKANNAAATIPGAESVLIDITDEDRIATALARLAPVDHIVVTTSAHHNVAVSELDHDKTAAAFEAKIIGPLMLAKHATQVLPATGSITLFSGFAAWSPTSGYSIMAITNGAVSFAVTHLAKELSPVRVNAISPGVIDSGSWDSMGEEAKKEFLDGAAEGTFVGRYGSNSDIAEGAVWLMGAGFVSGETIHIEGGARHA
ncbi:SDR family oxidoreductase [Corynebacterium glyciniphilum]|uniref:SDR family oxidoreductase n=1 Tax=Corynebacterium glyciniphilum TaxID=1404244 RepID=UPI003FD28F4F